MVRRVTHTIESRTVFAVGIAVLALFVAPTTRLVYAPQAVEITGTQVTMYRSFPGDAVGLPRPRMSYVETVRPLTPTHHGGQSCKNAGGPFKYSRSGEVGEWSIEWAADCLSDPAGYVWSAQWTWHVGGLKLGPASLDHTVFKGKAP